ncbi:hypothetical protein [Vibrio alginolyticus]
MDFKALFDKLKRSSSGGRSCFLVIQPDAVYLSSSIKSSRPYQLALLLKSMELNQKDTI